MPIAYDYIENLVCFSKEDTFEYFIEKTIETNEKAIFLFNLQQKLMNYIGNTKSIHYLIVVNILTVYTSMLMKRK